mgnify:CR=1 FL=1
MTQPLISVNSGEDLKDVGLDVTISVFDENNSSSMGTWKGLIDEANKDMGYLIPGVR